MGAPQKEVAAAQRGPVVGEGLIEGILGGHPDCRNARPVVGGHGFVVWPVPVNVACHVLPQEALPFSVEVVKQNIEGENGVPVGMVRAVQQDLRDKAVVNRVVAGEDLEEHGRAVAVAFHRLDLQFLR